ncbi:MAG: hypothetical protein A3D31_12565 [Candidatus Fluviicola riflensis]|nr:MAG: hypothetical protein A3D31_12565 [Candidatus Fluviicola riflensis]OGS84881.1 MAG: hypothetical protein A2724_09500 [Fluviicola sp. RIFCSPHIGHO2_01_FULL_43_53]
MDYTPWFIFVNVIKTKNMKKKILAFAGIGVLALTLIFSCTMMEKCCSGNNKNTTAGVCGNCGGTSCDKNCSANPQADSTKMNK